MKWIRLKHRRRSPQNLWLVKDDPEGTWWCKCGRGIVDAPFHDENTYPTVGTGWLFSCIDCGKAFMFARAVRIEQSFEVIAAACVPRIQTLIHPKTGEKSKEVLLESIRDWVSLVDPLIRGLVEGQRYVFFDGRVLPATPGPVKFRGLWRSHDLPDLPHLSADWSVLGDPKYWLEARE